MHKLVHLHSRVKYGRHIDNGTDLRPLGCVLYERREEMRDRVDGRDDVEDVVAIQWRRWRVRLVV